MKRTLMLGMAILAGALSMGATKANAAQFGVYVGVQPAYAQPPCPGPGYEWAAGYWNSGYWVPGRWNYIGFRGGYDRYYVDRDRRYDRDDFHGRDFDRDRGRDNGWRRDDHRFDRDDFRGHDRH